ncbi:hypothetical protein [Serratia marcescens]|uniref:MrpH family fimbial adhesin n=1 Tax=Serratia marcescens TaxID=615 RepID=UPI0023801592|nr:hypothetical protein [Serratia marcescens]
MKPLLRTITADAFLLLTLWLSQSAYAGWSADIEFFPSATNSGNNENHYTAKLTYWDTNDTTPNPLYGCSSLCEVSFFYNDALTNGGQMGKLYFKEIETSKTIGELATHFARYGYLNREFSSPFGVGNSGACLFFGYWGRVPGAGGGYMPTPFPGGMQCVPPVITPTVCDIGEQQLELKHGALRGEDINGNTVSTTMHVKCNFAFKVRVMSSDRSGSIYFNGPQGFRSDLKVDGVNLGKGKVINATPKGATLLLSSTLVGYDGSLGTFNGSKVIIVSLP